MKLLFDQNLSYKLVRSFSDEFPGSAHVRDLGLASAVDIEVWELCKTKTAGVLASYRAVDSSANS